MDSLSFTLSPCLSLSLRFGRAVRRHRGQCLQFSTSGKFQSLSALPGGEQRFLGRGCMLANRGRNQREASGGGSVEEHQSSSRQCRAGPPPRRPDSPSHWLLLPKPRRGEARRPICPPKPINLPPPALKWDIVTSPQSQHKSAGCNEGYGEGPQLHSLRAEGGPRTTGFAYSARTLRIYNTCDPDSARTLRIYNTCDPDSARTLRIYNTCDPDSARTLRIYNTCDPDSARTLRIYNTCDPDSARTLRIYNTCDPDSARTLRIYNTCDPDSARTLRIYNTCDPDSARTLRIYNTCDPDSARTLRIYNTCDPDSARTLRIYNTCDPDSARTLRIYNTCDPDSARTLRIYNTCDPDSARILRIYNTCDPDSARTLRIYNTVVIAVAGKNTDRFHFCKAKELWRSRCWASRTGTVAPQTAPDRRDAGQNGGARGGGWRGPSGRRRTRGVRVTDAGPSAVDHGRRLNPRCCFCASDVHRSLQTIEAGMPRTCARRGAVIVAIHHVVVKGAMRDRDGDGTGPSSLRQHISILAGLAVWKSPW
ncbi:hypothetical protein P4O66_000242 [Electrophorus voltai]|uniref:Uncharacterized protein n=1 Tax=Electrophorus voltai TaxID=2609070 RepID=A0AAD9E0W7_9TELE|nr:hypothetical protein P4O66_000242 [Electrophorus voltai]